MPEFREPPDVAQFLRRTEKTLANWRSGEIGPRYYKVHGRILYDMADVRAWLASQRVDRQPASQRVDRQPAAKVPA
jgi:hypothetical protein